MIFANDCRGILKYTKNVLCCDIHTRVRTKRLLKAAGAERVFGLDGTPNEPKLKYLADNDFAGLSGKALQDAIKNKIQQKDGSSLVGSMVSQGTTPRRLTDLIGSLCDLTSGSGDKGTPIVYKGYFDNYTNE